MKTRLLDNLEQLANATGIILVMIIFPTLSAISLGNEIAGSLGWAENTWGALILRVCFAIGLVGISAAFLLRNIRWDSETDTV